MILIADSGATKTDWCLIDPSNGHAKYFETQGVNPQVQSQVWISKMLLEEIPVTVQQIEFEHVCFYGAGISSLKLTSAMEQTLAYIFHSRTIEVRHDLLGAVRALCGRSPGIACILGTGSNSVYFDGERLVKKSHALGFILGDEGSGAFIGKQLVTGFLYNKLPEALADHFRSEVAADRDEILERVYREENPNRFLASLSRLLSDFRGEPYVEDLLFTSLRAFFENHVLIYSECRDVPTHFTGSIAHFYSDVLGRLLEEYGLRPGKVIRRPIEELVAYHLHVL